MQEESDTGFSPAKFCLRNNFSKKPLNPKDELKEKTEEELKAMLKQLEMEVEASLKLR